MNVKKSDVGYMSHAAATVIFLANNAETADKKLLRTWAGESRKYEAGVTDIYSTSACRMLWRARVVKPWRLPPPTWVDSWPRAGERADRSMIISDDDDEQDSSIPFRGLDKIPSIQNSEFTVNVALLHDQDVTAVVVPTAVAAKVIDFVTYVQQIDKDMLTEQMII